MLAPTYLVEKSALARLPRPEVERRLAPLLLSGKLARCGVLSLEVLFSARDHEDFVRIRAELDSLPLVSTAQRDLDRAIDVMELLARRGQHRGAGIPDLLIAAIAERTGLALLHYDRDFDLIGAVTGQRMEWVVPRGSVP